MASYAIYIAFGVVAGFTSALLGIGGGVVLVPAMIMVFALPAKTATATSLAYIVPIALYGVLKQWHDGAEIRWGLALMAVPLGLVGAELGIRAKQHLSNAWVQVIFAALMMAVGLRLGLQGLAALRQPSPPAERRAAVQTRTEPPRGPVQ
jgi:hypothetical protein